MFSFSVILFSVHESWKYDRFTFLWDYQCQQYFITQLHTRRPVHYLLTADSVALTSSTFSKISGKVMGKTVLEWAQVWWPTRCPLSRSHYVVLSSQTSRFHKRADVILLRPLYLVFSHKWCYTDLTIMKKTKINVKIEKKTYWAGY